MDVFWAALLGHHHVVHELVPDDDHFPPATLDLFRKVLLTILFFDLFHIYLVYFEPPRAFAGK